MYFKIIHVFLKDTVSDRYLNSAKGGVDLPSILVVCLS